MSPSQSTELAGEGAILFRYLLGSQPGDALIHRYRRAILKTGGEPLHLPALVSRFPALVRFVEAPLKPRSARQSLLRRRLDLALVLCETSPEGQSLLWKSPHQSRPGTIGRLCANLALDAVAMPVRFVAAVVWK